MVGLENGEILELGYVGRQLPKFVSTYGQYLRDGFISTFANDQMYREMRTRRLTSVPGLVGRPLILFLLRSRISKDDIVVS